MSPYVRREQNHNTPPGPDDQRTPRDPANPRDKPPQSSRAPFDTCKRSASVSVACAQHP